MKYAALPQGESFRAGVSGALASHADPVAAIQALQCQPHQARAEAGRVRQQNLQLALELRMRQGQEQQSRLGAAQTPRLTTRESEVLFWTAQRKTNEDTSQIMNISLSTVKKHLTSVFGKFGVDNCTPLPMLHGRTARSATLPVHPSR